VVGERDDIRIAGSRREAVLLLHGLTGVPNELHVLGGAIAADGYPVHIPLLPGRGTVPGDMDRLSWEDWMTAAVAAYDALALDHDAVIVGGLSAGGTMALDLALRRPVRALLLYAAAISVSRRVAYLAPYGWRVIRRWPSPGSGRRDDRSVGPDEDISTYDPIPIRAVAELVHGMRRVRPRLGTITAPALVLHAAGDPYVPAASGREIARRLGGPVELGILPGDGHAITAGQDREVVAARTRAAVDDLLAGLAPGSCAVVATHGVAARTIVASLVGLDQSLAWRSIAGLHNCHWAEVGEYADAWRIVAWNVGTNPL